MEQKTDAELVLLARAGNSDAFGYLVERYQQMVRRIAIPMVRQRKKQMRRVTIDSVREHPETQQNVVILQDENAQQLVIWIGKAEAWAIARCLNEVDPPRPMTTQLMLNLLQASGAELLEVRIEALKEEVFYAVLKIHSSSGEREVDARPSDALALAAVVKCPIHVADEVMEQCTGFPEGKLVRPVSTFTVIDREAILKEQEEQKAWHLKLAASLPEIEAQLHKQEEEQTRPARIAEWKKEHGKDQEE